MKLSDYRRGFFAVMPTWVFQESLLLDPEVPSRCDGLMTHEVYQQARRLTL